MDKTRIELFCKEYAVENLPSYKTLSLKDISKVTENLGDKLNLPYKNNIAIFNYIQERGRVIFKINDKNEKSFNFSKLFKDNVGIFEEEIIVFWCSDEADVFCLSDFSLYFYGLWWSEADDILITGIHCTWCLIITHYGNIIML